MGASIKDLGKKWFAFSKMEDFKPEELVAKINEAFWKANLEFKFKNEENGVFGRNKSSLCAQTSVFYPNCEK